MNFLDVILLDAVTDNNTSREQYKILVKSPTKWFIKYKINRYNYEGVLNRYIFQIHVFIYKLNEGRNYSICSKTFQQTLVFQYEA